MVNQTLWTLGLIGVTMIIGCASTPPVHCAGESVVLAGTQPTNLLHTRVRHDVVVCSTYLPGGMVYEEGRDFVVDRDSGRSRAHSAPGSRTFRRTSSTERPTSITASSRDTATSRSPST